ncbi:MAG: type II toxin-antitoxin system HicB family antitoxin [Elainella sp. Prado103]|jgi:predicted HicB family RNase H-like nuclease|nr:type II toxin-antitoxin system HicB family antitoxin [Elainella sp. Prado103]
MFRYKNYIGKPEVDIATRTIHGRLLNITDVIEFKGSTVEDAEADFKRAVDSYLKFCEDQGKQPEKPFSGKLPFRTTPEIHRDIYIAASRADRSINAWMEDILSQAARRLNSSPQVKPAEENLEYSIAEYRFLLTRLQEKINRLQGAIEPHLSQRPEAFSVLLSQIKPILKDKELPELIEKVEIIRKRLDLIRDQEASLRSFIEQAPELSSGIASPDPDRSIPEVANEMAVTQDTTLSQPENPHNVTSNLEQSIRRR